MLAHNGTMRPGDGILSMCVRIGEAAEIPPGTELQSCFSCNTSVWCDPGLRENADRHQLIIKYVCNRCIKMS